MVTFQDLNGNLADENLRGGLIYGLIEFTKAGEKLSRNIVVKSTLFRLKRTRRDVIVPPFLATHLGF